MLTAEQLDQAVSTGIISNEQARQLTALANGQLDPKPPSGEERLRLIGGFNDVFVSIGIILVFWALLSFVGAGLLAAPSMIFAFSAALAWGLAEFFTRRMRLALPSILLAVTFCASALFAMAYLFIPANLDDWWDAAVAASSARTIILPGLALAAAAALHFWRFRVPIDIAIVVAAVVGSVLGLSAQNNIATFSTHLAWFLLIAGIAVFAVAMIFDMSDPSRQSWRSDAAFWLHMLAAPMIVHPAIFGLAGGGGLTVESSPGVILALFALFTIIAIIIDRRALIVSALAYAGGAIGYYLSDSLFSGTGITLLTLGGVILALSAGWQPLRRAIIPLLPLGWLKAKLPPA
jgi:hypothetical protein